VTQELDQEIKSFYLRPLEEFPVIYLDARYEKVRHGGHIKNMAVLWAVGVDNEGRRQVLGLSCKLSESEVHWRGFLSSLIERGLSGVQLTMRALQKRENPYFQLCLGRDVWFIFFATQMLTFRKKLFKLRYFRI
jgi:transposase-like protein